MINVARRALMDVAQKGKKKNLRHRIERRIELAIGQTNQRILWCGMSRIGPMYSRKLSLVS